MSHPSQRPRQALGQADWQGKAVSKQHGEEKEEEKEGEDEGGRERREEGGGGWRKICSMTVQSSLAPLG